MKLFYIATIGFCALSFGAGYETGKQSVISALARIGADPANKTAFGECLVERWTMARLAKEQEGWAEAMCEPFIESWKDEGLK